MNFPVNLTEKGEKTFSVSGVNSCTFSVNNFVHDYSGCHSRWETIQNDEFVALTMVTNKQSFNIEVTNITFMHAELVSL